MSFASARRSAAPFRVVIAGGGVAAIEAALALRELARDRIVLTIAAEATEFVYRPLAVLRPFRARPTYRIELARVAADLDAELVPANALAVEAGNRELVLATGRRLAYDALVVAIGASAEAVVGGGTLTPWDWGEGHAFRSILAALTKGEAKSVTFIVPAGLTWTLPLYELALLTSAQLRKEGVDDALLSLVTAEQAPLEDFSAEASATVARLFRERRITLLTGAEVTGIEAGTVRTSSGASTPADVTVAVPIIRSRTLAGLPTDAAGFIKIDRYCRVVRKAGVFAAGDCTNQPLKQGGLAAQQADCAAAGIAALAGAPVAAEPFRPELRALLLTGETPLGLDRTGARPVLPSDRTVEPETEEKIVARYLTSYLTRIKPARAADAPPRDREAR